MPRWVPIRNSAATNRLSMIPPLRAGCGMDQSTASPIGVDGACRAGKARCPGPASGRRREAGGSGRHDLPVLHQHLQRLGPQLVARPSAGSPIRHTARSARALLGQRARSAKPRARATTRVTPASAFSAVRPNRTQAMFSASSGEVPGLARWSPPPAARRGRETAPPAVGGSRAADGRHPAAARLPAACGAHRPRPVLAGMFQMVGGQAAEPRGQRRPAQIAELVGMQLHRQPKLPGRREQPGDLGRRERYALAEGVDGVDQALPSASSVSIGPRARSTKPCRSCANSAGRAWRASRLVTTSTPAALLPIVRATRSMRRSLSRSRP